MSLAEVVEQARCAFGRVAGRKCCVIPAVPILFFGDLTAYQVSPLRIVTVGLNPSLHEFPANEPFRRFPLARDGGDQEPSRYIDAMSAYFRTDPYRGWFSSFEPLLNGLDASYYRSKASTVIHTDICSPVATSPTWSQLDRVDRTALAADGGPLWHTLLEELRPQVVALSVARSNLERIEFAPMSDWEIVHRFPRTADGGLRSHPYDVYIRWHKVGGEQSLFVFGRAAQKPFGLLHDDQKRQAGQKVLQAYHDVI